MKNLGHTSDNMYSHSDTFRYLAHISEDKIRSQTILEHAEGTAKLAGEFASKFGCKDWGYNCGLLHDLGKYSEKFQKRLQGGPKTDHSTAGAKEVYQRRNIVAAYCIAGHHSGLPDGGSSADAGGAATLYGRMQKGLEDYSAFQKEIKIPSFSQPKIRMIGTQNFSFSFFIRMLFSCLVDADYLDTEIFMAKGVSNRGKFDSAELLLARLYEKINPWLNNVDDSTVNGRRTLILKACLEMGEGEQGLYQLTVPTGGGKTISSLAFALRHAVKHGLERVIYVIPYNSIIEQNAAVFRDILGKKNVLEDHCNVTYKDDEEDSEETRRLKLATENWDCPVVVTTNVQFFESLFSNKTSKCRKIHNLARSIIIFDEAQMLPVNYLKPCIHAISELVGNYQSTAVLCTATQPSLQPFFPKEFSIREICPDIQGQYEFFRRTSIRNENQLSEDELVCQLQNHEQVLCILNSRKRVQRVYETLNGDGNFHLSTYLYPIHRKRVLTEIKRRLKERRPCKVIATSLVEAGVDFDFQTVYRELAGIDSVIQAAGRCNREGKLDRKECETVVFTLEKDDTIRLPQSLKLPENVAAQIKDEYEDIASLDAISAYFSRLYRFRGEQGLDTKNILKQLSERSIPFAAVADQFRLIETDTVPILIDQELEAIRLVEQIRRGECSRQLARDAGQYCVNLYRNDFDRMNGAGLLEMLDLGFYRLRNPEQYSMSKGLEIQAERGDALLL